MLHVLMICVTTLFMPEASAESPNELEKRPEEP